MDYKDILALVFVCILVIVVGKLAPSNPLSVCVNICVNNIKNLFRHKK